MFILGMINPNKALIPFAKQGRKQVFLTWFIAGFVCLILVGVTSDSEDASSDNVTVSESTEEAADESLEEPAVEEGTYDTEIALTGTIVKGDGTLTVDITTNIIDGAIIDVFILNDGLDSLSDVVEVKNGEATIEFTLPEEWNPQAYAGSVSLNFNKEEHSQPDEVKVAYGEKGELITSKDAQDQDDGGVSVHVLTNSVFYPDEETVQSFKRQEMIDKYADLKYEGSNQDVIQDIILPTGLSTVTFNYTGSSNFIVYLHSSTGKDLIVNEIGRFNGTIPVFGEGPFMLEVDGAGSWTADFNPMLETDTAIFEGNGFNVSGYFSAPKETVWTVSHDGRSNFIVYLHTDKGSELVQNEIGVVDGTIILDIPSGSTICLWEVQADGNWSLKPKE